MSDKKMNPPPAAPATVTITMRPDQATVMSKWLGEHRVVDLPDPICDALYAMCIALRRGESIDVTKLTGVEKKS